MTGRGMDSQLAKYQRRSAASGGAVAGAGAEAGVGAPGEGANGSSEPPEPLVVAAAGLVAGTGLAGSALTPTYTALIRRVCFAAGLVTEARTISALVLVG